MGFIGALIWWLVIGAIIGLIARAVMPGKQAMGIGTTIVLGVVGALVGGFIGGLFGSKGVSGGLPHDQVTVVVSGREAHGRFHDGLVFDGGQS
ncbi:GlsB/YeaQ/YmgE family stress response membrane protein, partial [Brachybacterium sp. NPDC056505]|uniref:GlsB/YeaQ/YmgE family stress response membrane protein n=1 Tax=Brachybacterium sp. NPDC056505 TaxID=3345843 RepID=UPI00366A9B37